MQREQFDISKAPVPPLRAEPRFGKNRDAEGHIRGVEASSGGLIRATIGSAVAAGATLVLVWLPAEYGIDATGVGGLLGLTDMGEIKQQLYVEAAAEDAALAAQPAAIASAPVVMDPQIVDRLAAIEARVAAIAAAVGAVPDMNVAPAIPGAMETAVAPPQPTASGWRDEVSYTLAPTEGVEIKLVVEEGVVIEFEWTANGAVLNYDTHGDGGGQSVSYDQGRGVPGQEGELVAAFTGNHGWFWRNRTDAPVTLILRTRGDYSAMKAP